MILIADTSALIALSACDALPLLEALFREVRVPQAVADEATRPDKPEAARLRNWLAGKVTTVDTRRSVVLDAYADLGETEAMLLYKQLDADRLLIDDKRGRRIAALNHIRVIGSIGVLLTAKRAGLIPVAAPYLERLAASTIFLDPRLLRDALELAGE